MTKTTEQGGLIAAKKEALQAQAESKTKNLKEFINETRMQEWTIVKEIDRKKRR